MNNSNLPIVAPTQSITAKPGTAKPVRRAICAAVALVITAVTTQVIVRSVGEREYGFAASVAAAREADADRRTAERAPSIVLAQAR